jgi:hypothetical protein
MKKDICMVGIIAMSSPVHAARFKCMDADGNISFSDKPCPGQKQEALKEPSVSAAEPEVDAAAPVGAADVGGMPEIEPLTRLAVGTKVTSSSPLAKVYTAYIEAVRRCDRAEMMKHMSSAMAAEMTAAPDSEFTPSGPCASAARGW